MQGLNEVLRATTHVRAMGQGGSQSQLMRTDDGGYYVVKFMGNDQGTRILANEFVTGKIGTLLGASVPDLIVVFVNDSLTAEINSKVGCHFMSGPQFATSYMENAVAVSGLDSIARTDNASNWGSSIVLDTLTANQDRKAEHVLICTNDQDRTVYREIDHGHTLGVNAGWHALNSQRVNLVAPLFRELICGPQSFEYPLEKLSLISSSSINAILNEIPPEWAIVESEMKSLESFIHEVSVKMRGVIDSSKTLFPNWR